ncbi:MAG: hypothetical protein ACRC33_04450 [Gemmataceae bacterium]
MKTETVTHRDVDLALFEENNSKFPVERLQPYIYQYVAFNWDGTEIIDSAETDQALVAKLDARGIPSTAYVIGWAGP